MKKRTCRYCGTELKGSGGLVACNDPVCQAKKEADRLESVRINMKKKRDQRKLKRIQAKPKFCLNCGKQFGLDDHYIMPVCTECIPWWDENKDRIKKERLKKRDRSKPKAKPKKVETVEVPEFEQGDGWSQQKYNQLQRKLNAHNGKTCLTDGCDGKCKGFNRYCDKCRERQLAIANGSRVDGNWNLETSINDGFYDRVGVMS
jgi:hypothetical protein